MKKPGYKRVIKRVLLNKSNNQLQLTIPKDCGINKGDLIRLVSFNDEKKVNDDIIVKVIMNKAVEQLLVTVPRNSGFKKGDLVETIPLTFKEINMDKYPIYERSDVYKGEDGLIKMKEAKK